MFIKKKLLSKLSKIKLSTKLILAMFCGIIFGLILRNFHCEIFNILGINGVNLKKISNVFLNLIKMISLPLIFTSIISSIISIDDIEKTGKLAIKSMIIFTTMTSLCVLIGMLTSIYFKPGIGINFNKENIIQSNVNQTKLIIQNSESSSSLFDFICSIVPSNFFEALVKNNFLQVIFFAIIFGIAILKSSTKNKELISNGIIAMSEICMSMIKIVMEFAPIGIFGITTWLFESQDIELIKSLGRLILIVMFNCIIIVYGIYSLITIVKLKMNPIPFFKKIIPAQIMALLTASSSATLSLAMDITNKKLGVSKEKINFVMPLGATVNMNGGAMYFGSACIFLSQLFGIEFTLHQYLVTFIMSIFCAVGTAPIPGSSIFLLNSILISVGIPIEAIGIIFAIDRILDMLRTFVNISGDIFAAFIISAMDKDLDTEQYNSYEKLTS